MSACRELTCPHHGPDNRQALVVYRGTMPIQETPPDAVIGHCPVGLCVWRQSWDTPAELTEASLRHVREDHGEEDPETAILRAQFRAEAESRSRRSW